MALANYAKKKAVSVGGFDRRSRPGVRRALAAAWTAAGINREALVVELPARWAITVPALVIALIVGGAAVEPAPAEDATGAAAILDGVLAAILATGFVATIGGAMMLRRWGIASAFGVALFSLGLVVTCPLSGHHTFGAWFAGEMALVMAATAVAGYGLFRTNK